MSGVEKPPAWNLPSDTSAVGIEDLYKLLHQAYRGPGHAVVSREAAARYLREEWARLDSARADRDLQEATDAAAPALADEDLVEELVAGAPFVRINLRPYMACGGSVDSLLDAFIRSAAAPADSAIFARAWQLVAGAISRGELPWSTDDYRGLDAETRPAGYPAIHHSRRYIDRFRPAYRVLCRTEADRLMGALPGGRAAK